MNFNKPVKLSEVVTMIFLTIIVSATLIGGDDFAKQYGLDFWREPLPPQENHENQ